MAEKKRVNAIQNISSLDVAIMLPLNNAHAEETSALDDASFTALIDTAFYARGIDRGATAFLIAPDHKASYLSPNFFGSRRPANPLSTLIALLS